MSLVRGGTRRFARHGLLLVGTLGGCHLVWGADAYTFDGGAGGSAGGSGGTGGGGAGGAPTCGGLCPPEACCGGSCVSIADDENNCGACGVACPGTVCFGGECTGTCELPYQNCDQNLANGCEADLTTDTANCGVCGLACVAGATCANGSCVCPPGFTDCNGNPLDGCESDVEVDPQNCGRCGQTCGPSSVCVGGSCTCAAGFDDCDGDSNNGCEEPLDSPLHCGGCAVACGVNTVCDTGSCGCAAGFLDCDLAAGCEASASDPGSCGACGVVCAPPLVCDGSCVVACGGGTTNCSGACVDLQTSSLHCGGCDQPVGPQQSCVGGAPACDAGWDDCSVAPGCETNVSSDDLNCGACGLACKPGAVCVQSVCLCSAAAPKDCGADCRVCCSDLDCADGDGCTSDVCAPGGTSCSNPGCGAGEQCCSQSACLECCSDSDCAGGETCSGGVCSSGCAPPLVLCGGECVDVTSDSRHCNGCNQPCGSDATCACVAGACTGGTIYFSEDFSDNFKGWSVLSPHWQIGSAQASVGQALGFADPANDHGPSGDNGVLGAVLGGNYLPETGYHGVSSPVVDLSGAAGTVKLTYWRWLNGGAPAGDMAHGVSVKDGGTKAVWSSEGVITDSGWVRVEHDVTQYKNANFQVLFIYNFYASGSAALMSGWNVDDVTLSSGTCE